MTKKIILSIILSLLFLSAKTSAQGIVNCGNTNICQGAIISYPCSDPLGDNWSSSNTTIATVNGSGYITGVSPGTATITFYTLSVLLGDLVPFSYCTITVNAPTAAPTSNSPVCAGSTLSFNANATGATTYAWTGPNSFSNATATPSITGATTAATGVYSLTLTSAAGCTNKYTISATVNANPTAAPTSNSPVCAGSTLSFNANATGATTYAWTGPNSFSNATATPSITGATTAATGVYSLTLTSAAGCTNKYTISATVNANPTAAPTSNSPVCAGSTLSFNANATGAATYAWTGPNSFSNATATPSITSATTAATGVYSLTVTSAAGCTNNYTISATVNANPTAAPTSNSPVCAGSTLSFNANATGATTYAWTGPNSFSDATATPSITGATTAATGVYSLTVTSAAGCTNNYTTSATVNANPTAAPTSNSPVCAGSTLSFNANASGATTYAWIGPNSFSDATATPSITGATTAATGVYSLTVTSAAGCTNNYTISATVNANPTAAPTSNSPVCAGSTLSFNANATGATTYAWIGPNSFSDATATPSITGATTAATGVYSLTVTSAAGCTNNYTISATVNANPTAAPTSNSPVCAGSTLSFNANASGATTYAWTGPNSFSDATATPSITGATTAATGAYSLTVTSAAGCTNNYTISATVNALPTAAPSYNTLVCSGGTLDLMANDMGASSYAWSGPNSFTSTNENPVITSVNAVANGTYTLIVTSAASCSASYTMSVTIGGTLALSVSETTPFALSGDRIFTYCSGGLTLLVNSVPALPDSGVTYTWSGPSTTVTSSASFSPSFTPGGSAVTYPYTVSVTYNGCASITTDTVVVPVSGCSPCDYYNVNNYRANDSLPPLASCSNCGNTQPFHTIIASMLTSSNVVDNASYYIVNSPVADRATFTGDLFYMNSGTNIFIDSITAVTFSACHFFASPACRWRGLEVIVTPTSAGSLTLTNNTLVENGGGTDNLSGGLFTGGVFLPSPANAYYNPSMPDIFHADGAIFNRNYGAITMYNYQPAVSVLPGAGHLPYTIQNSVFSCKDIAGNDTGTTATANYPFTWPSVSSLKTVVSGGAGPIFGSGAYKNTTRSQEGHSAFLIDNMGSSTELTPASGTTPATYAYNYMNLGDTANDPTSSLANLYDSLQFAVQINTSNVRFYNNTLSNMINTGIGVGYNYNNDVQLIGDTASHNNNRLYNCRYGLLGYSYDFTCKNAYMSGLRNSTTVPPGIGLFFLLDSGHNVCNVSYNYIYNYTIGINVQYDGSVTYGYANGNFYFNNNYILGKSSAADSGSNVQAGIYLSDGRSSSLSNGYAYADSNTMIGVNGGIALYSNAQNIYADYNYITMQGIVTPPQEGIYAYYCRYLREINNNSITGLGYNCGNFIFGIYLLNVADSSGSSNISCNIVQDLTTGFEFGGTSALNWRNNEMLRDYKGLVLVSGGTIGTQGGPCDPIDNSWEGDACDTCLSCGASWPGWNSSSIYQTYIDVGGSTAGSVLYVRDSAHYTPTINGSYTATPYTLGSTLINTCSGTLPPVATCVDIADARNSSGNTGNTGNVYNAVTATDVMIYPNPGNGDFVIVSQAIGNNAANVRVMNSVGELVYSGSVQFSNGVANLALQQLASGVYLVQFNNGSNGNTTKKVVIER